MHIRVIRIEHRRKKDATKSKEYTIYQGCYKDYHTEFSESVSESMGAVPKPRCDWFEYDYDRNKIFAFRSV